MTPKLENGVFVTDTLGNLIDLSDAEAILQQVIILLSIKKGSFSINPNLGSDLLNADLNQCSEEYLFQIISDSLLKIPKVKVLKVTRTAVSENHKLSLSINLIVNKQEYSILLPI